MREIKKSKPNKKTAELTRTDREKNINDYGQKLIKIHTPRFLECLPFPLEKVHGGPVTS